jgi:predicted short-subunit dehydrogenase-like oxidoreductase (DUF2520 family)
VSQNSPIDDIGIAGAGRIGQALGRLLIERGQPVAAIAGRDTVKTDESAKFVGTRGISYEDLPGCAGRILIAVPDDAIESVAARLADAGMRGGMVIHTSGARGPEALAALEAQGVSCAAMHPLQTISTPRQGVAALPGSVFGISGVGAARAWAEEIATILGGEILAIAPEDRPLYHAAAVMASNYLVALLDAAAILMGEAGISGEQALRALTPLIRASVENVLDAGPMRALTGPVERGDTGTVAAHLRALGGTPETVRRLYRSAGLHAVQLALRKNPGVDRTAMERLLREDLRDV